MDQNKQKTLSRLKKLIVLLAILLMISCIALAARHVYSQYLAQPAQVTVSDNLLYEDETENPSDDPSSESGQGGQSVQSSSEQAGTDGETGTFVNKPSAPTVTTNGEVTSGTGSSAQDGHQATVLELYQGRPDANQKFQAENLFPGDQVTRYYCVRVYHDQPVQISFRSQVTQQTKTLGDDLRIRVVRLESDNTLCDDTFTRVDGQAYSERVQSNQEGVTELYYRIDVYAPTSMGNEYQQASLTADFEWYAQDIESDSSGQGSVSRPGTSDNVTALTPPQTADSSQILLWGTIALTALLLAVLLWITGKKETEKDGRG